MYLSSVLRNTVYLSALHCSMYNQRFYINRPEGGSSALGGGLLMQRNIFPHWRVLQVTKSHFCSFFATSMSSVCAHIYKYIYAHATNIGQCVDVRASAS